MFFYVFFCGSSQKYTVSSGWRSSFVLKMNWRQQKCSKFCKKRMIMNVYLVRTFSNGKVSFAMARRAWMKIWEQGTPKTSRMPKHITKVQAALADNQYSTIRMLAERFHIDKEIIRKISTEDLGGKNCERDLFPMHWHQNNGKVA